MDIALSFCYESDELIYVRFNQLSRCAFTCIMDEVSSNKLFAHCSKPEVLDTAICSVAAKYICAEIIAPLPL